MQCFWWHFRGCCFPCLIPDFIPVTEREFGIFHISCILLTNSRPYYKGCWCWQSGRVLVLRHLGDQYFRGWPAPAHVSSSHRDWCKSISQGESERRGPSSPACWVLCQMEPYLIYDMEWSNSSNCVRSNCEWTPRNCIWKLHRNMPHFMKSTWPWKNTTHT